VKALPLGGYVKIAGMNPYQPVPPEDVPRSYAAKPPLQRALVILAGPITHFLIAMIALTVLFAGFGTPRYRPVIDGVQQTLSGQPSPAFVAGLQPGDAVVAVNGVPVSSADQFVSITRAHPGRPIVLTVDRGGVRYAITATPEYATVAGQRFPRLGVTVGDGALLGYDRTNPVRAVGRAAIYTGSVTKAVIVRLGDVFGPAGIHRVIQLLGGAPRTANDVSSVVGASRVAGQAAQAHDWSALLFLFATINIFVGILNLVPLPPFDGGHLAVVAWEKLTRRRLDQRRLAPVAAVVLGFVLLFSLSVIYLDLVNPVPNPFR
jgi:RIP metalloprotease RseP